LKTTPAHQAENGENLLIKLGRPRLLLMRDRCPSWCCRRRSGRRLHRRCLSAVKYRTSADHHRSPSVSSQSSSSTKPTVALLELQIGKEDLFQSSSPTSHQDTALGNGQVYSDKETIPFRSGLQGYCFTLRHIRLLPVTRRYALGQQLLRPSDEVMVNKIG